MKKLKLDLDDVELESFEMAPQESASGTVHGMTADDGCWSWNVTGCLTGCNGSYDPTGCACSQDWSYCACFTAADSNCTAT